MKTRYKVALAIAAIAFALMPLLLFADTNTVAAATNAVPVLTPPAGTNVALTLPPGFEQAISILPPKAQTWVRHALVWVGSFSGLFALVGGIFGRWIRNKLNAAAESADEGQNAKLRSWFSNPLYVIAAYLLRTVSIVLPTVAELDRAVRLQEEAIHENLVEKGYPPIPPTVT